MVATQVPAAPIAPRVLIVDQSPESREVLHTLLESRGVSSAEVAEAREGLALVAKYHPAVIVLDVDAESADDPTVQAAFDTATQDSRSALVVLGRTRHFRERLPDCQVLAKPYHYGPLLRTIEALLAGG